jgi:hypothetical protein
MTEEQKPLLIQIDDEIREMTPEETAAHEVIIANAVSLEQQIPSDE